MFSDTLQRQFDRFINYWLDALERSNSPDAFEASKHYVIILGGVGIAIGLGSYLTRIVWRKWIQPQPKPAEGEDEEQLSNPFHPREWEVLAVLVGIVEILYISHISFDFLGMGAGIGIFFWGITCGVRTALEQLSLPRKANLLVDLPDHIGQPFVTAPWEYGLFLGVLISLHIGGVLKFWTTLGLNFGGYFCGWIPAWFLTLKWLWRQSPMSVGVWSINLRRSIGWRSGALAILEVYANVEPKDYASPEILTHKLQGRLGWLISQEPRYPLALADALGAVGNLSDCANLFEAIFGIDEATYQVPEKLAAKVQNLTATLPSDVGAKYVVNLAVPLVAIGFPERGLAVLNAYFGLSNQDYSEPHDLEKILRERLQSLPEELGYEMILTLASLLSVFQPAYGICLLEAYLGVPGGDYTDLSVSAITVAQLKQLPEDIQFKFGMFLAAALDNIERSTEAGALLAEWFELKNETGDVAVVQSILKQLPKEKRANILQLLASYWNNSGRHQESLALLESYLKLKPRDYSSPRRLRERLQSLSTFVTSSYLLQLSNSLSFSDRAKDARSVLESYLWIEPKLYRNPKKLSQTLDDRLQYLAIEMQFTLVSLYAYKLLNEGRSDEAFIFQHAHAQIHPSLYGQPQQLAQQLYNKLQKASPTSASNYLETLMTVLETQGQNSSAALVSNIWLYIFVRPCDPDYENQIEPSVLCSMFERWLQYFGKNEDSDREDILAICRFIIPQLRQTLVETAVTLEDRKRFIETTTSLRQKVVETGLYRLQRETDAIQSSESEVEVLLWDFELSQRILLERFLLLPLAEDAETDNGLDIVPGWSSEIPVEEIQERLDLLLADLSLEDSIPEELVIASGDASPSPPKTPTFLTTAKLSWLEEAKAIIAHGLSIEDLKKVLSSSTVLLRALFLSDGTLTWTALRHVEAGQIEIVAHGTGNPYDQYRLRWLNAFHDFQIALIDLRHKCPDKLQQWVFEMQPLLKAVRKCLEKASHPENFPKLVGNLVEATEKLFSNKDKISESLKILAYLPLQDQQLQLWIERPNLLLEHWDRLTHLLSLLQGDLTRVERKNISHERDRITSKYLRELAEIWRLDSLTPVLDPATTDIVLLLDDILHSLPVAHLPVPEQPLFCQVRSIRESLAFLLDELQQEIEEQMFDNTRARGRLMTVSWFDLGDNGIYLLHKGQAKLAQSYQMEWYSASDKPPGHIGSVQQGLQQFGSFRVVTICGHGHPDVGVKLANRDPWRGQGCHLDLVEFLVLVSCSVGRVTENGTRDVEGLVVELAIHRARSVLACRWPVFSVPAAIFANTAIAKYLELHHDFNACSTIDNSCLRARAVNAARKKLLSNDTSAGYPPVGLYTIAAFELYGLG